jgi:ribonuclease E
MSDETPGTEPTAAGVPTVLEPASPPSTATPEPAGNGDSPSGREPQASGGGVTPAPRKRRRGKRGGRNRNRRPAGATASGGNANAGDVDIEDEEDAGDETLPQSWNDPAADRGYTSDDVLDAALEEAELEPPGAADGDSDTEADDDGAHGAPFLKPSIPPPAHHTPAPAAANGGGTGSQSAGSNGSGANSSGGNGASASGGAGTGPKKRRRRGGRNRNKKSSTATSTQGGGGNVTAAAKPSAPSYVEGTLDTGDFDGAALLETLDEATLEKRRGLQRKGRPTGRYMMVVHTHRPSGRSHVAVLEGRNLVEHYVAEPQDDERNIDGNIYWGKVQNVQPGMEAAFVDIGTQKNAILYRGDVRPDIADADGGAGARIERMLRNGQAILTQVTKNPIMHKGARLTQDVSLAGRFVVMVPDQPGTYGISKRLPDDERRRLRRILDRLRPANAGLIVRTAAEGATEDELERDMKRLQYQWEQIDKLRKQVRPGTLLYKEPPLAIRVIREEFTKEYRGIVIDDVNLYNEVRSYVEAVAPELADRVELYDEVGEGLPLFERYHVHEQLHKALDRKVWLPSGGSLVIERTEALTVIDVNTAKNVGKSNLEETVFRNNLEAAEGVARELRLRDIGGIIVIDFIDMEIKQNRETVERTFREALARDKTRTQIYPISELGLVEMTRKRVSEGLVESFSEMCPHCEGRGILIDHSLYEE